MSKLNASGAKKLLKSIFDPDCSVSCHGSGVVLDETVTPFTWTYCTCDLGHRYKREDDAGNSREEKVVLEDGTTYFYCEKAPS